jgi:hypothetical protein
MLDMDIQIYQQDNVNTEKQRPAENKKNFLWEQAASTEIPTQVSLA